jgi:hypothetical protein
MNEKRISPLRQGMTEDTPLQSFLCQQEQTTDPISAADD